MKKSTRTQNTPALENLVTDEAKRQAQSLGVTLESFIGGIAMKGETMPVAIRIRMDDIRRINAVVRGGRIAEWIEGVVVDALNGQESGNRISLDLDSKMAARLRKAAEFEEVSVVAYLLDGLKRDLRLTEESMPPAK